MSIIINVCGGIGNQMFQYAFGRHLAIRNQSQLFLDISAINQPPEGMYYDHRYFLLDNFNIDWKIAELNNLKKEDHYIYQLENKFCFDPYKLELKGNLFLKGYWQSPLYFSDIKSIILKDFMLKKELEGPNREIANIIIQSDSVSIHIRRGDYVKNDLWHKTFGVCPIDYYKKAINKILEQIKSPVFFIFSDDIEWAKQNLNFIDFPTYFMSNNDPEFNSHNDLALMSLCKHNIIANSTFSWWAAYLNENPHKVVIAPNRWFRDSFYYNVDLVPNEWTRI